MTTLRVFLLRNLSAPAMIALALSAPVPVQAQPVQPTLMSGVFVVGVAQAVQWQGFFNIPASTMFASVSTVSSMLDLTAQDAKNMGFNTLILYSEQYPGLTSESGNWTVNVPYNSCVTWPSGVVGCPNNGIDFVGLTSAAAVKYGLNLIVSLAPATPIYSADSNFYLDWANTCTNSPWNLAQVNYYAKLPNVTGVMCAFEDWSGLSGALTTTQLTGLFTGVQNLKTYIQDTTNTQGQDLYYLSVPETNQIVPAAAGTSAIDTIATNNEFYSSFTAISRQLNSTTFYTQPLMNGSFAMNLSPAWSSVVMSIWSGTMLGSPLGSSPYLPANCPYQSPASPVGPATVVVPDECLVEEWQQLQLNALLQYRPNFLTWESYDRIGFPSYAALPPNTSENYYGARGWVMSANARLSDRTLSFYDPMESAESTVLISGVPAGSPDPDVTYVADGCDAIQGPDGTQAANFGGGGTARIETQKAITYPFAANAPFISSASGTISLWVRPLTTADWNGVTPTPVKSHVLAAACPASYGDSYTGPNGTDILTKPPSSTPSNNDFDCMMLQLTNSNWLTFTIADYQGRNPTASFNAGSWAPGTWHHVAAAWNHDVASGQLPTIQLFVDGQLVGDIHGNSGNLLANWAVAPLGPQFVVGNRWDTGAYAADADIDDVRVYNTPLNATQIQTLYSTFLDKGNVGNASCPSPSM